MVKVTERNLATFVVCAYNQEQTIEAAVRAAFAQTYDPLEIILSDDCSTDKTFNIMTALAAGYTGRHKVVLNRNSANLGIAGHVSRVFGLSNGVWVVLAAGDDVSTPERTEVLLQRCSRYSSAKLVFSQAYVLAPGQSPDSLGLAVASNPIGATEAFHKDTFVKFGPLLGNTYNEDWAFYFRAQLTGEVLLVRKPLVYYRISDQSLTAKYYKRGFLGVIDVHSRNLEQFSADISAVQRFVNDPDRFESLRCDVEIRREVVSLMQSVTRGGQIAGDLARLNLPFLVRVSLLLLTQFPWAFPYFDRLERTRIGRFSPSRVGMSYINPCCMLTPPTLVD